jgi:TIR domain
VGETGTELVTEGRIEAPRPPVAGFDPRFHPQSRERKPMNRIFLSYAHKDGSEAAEWLYTRLKGCGYEVWKDNHSLPLGGSFPKEISNAMDRMDFVLVLLSAAAVASDWVQEEIDMAKVARRQMIPILLEQTEVPPYLKTIHSLELKAGINDWRALHQLVNHLGAGSSLPRVYNMSGYPDIEVNGALVLGHSEFGHVDLSSPQSIADTARTMAEAACPFIREAGAGIVPHGHPALACGILAHLLGITNQLPPLFYTSKLETGKFGIRGDRFVSLQNMREVGLESRNRKRL